MVIRSAAMSSTTRSRSNTGDRQHGGAADERREAASLVAEGVEERVHDQVAVATAQVRQVAPLGIHPQVLQMVHHHALGPAGGARRVDDVGDIGSAHRSFERTSRLHEPRLQIDGGHAGRSVEILPQEALLDQHRLGTAAGDDVGGLGLLVARADRNHDAPGCEHTERCDHPIRGVGRPDRDPVALVHAKLRECACRTAHPISDLAERETQRTVDDCFTRRRIGPPRSGPSRGWSPRSGLGIAVVSHRDEARRGCRP